MLFRSGAGAATSAPAWPETVTSLVEQYQQAEEFIAKVKILKALTELKEAAALDALRFLFLLETDEDLQVETLFAMGTIPGPNVIQAIAVGLEEIYPTEVRLAAIIALEDVDRDEVIPVLTPLQDDPNPEIRQAAEIGRAHV